MARGSAERRAKFHTIPAELLDARPTFIKPVLSSCGSAGPVFRGAFVAKLMSGKTILD
jgi:hypothetical protein